MTSKYQTFSELLVNKLKNDKELAEEFLKATGCEAAWESTNCNGYSYAKKP